MCFGVNRSWAEMQITGSQLNLQKKQGRKVKSTFGEHHTKSGISTVLRDSNSRNISPCSVAVFDMKEWVLSYQLAEILTPVTI